MCILSRHHSFIHSGYFNSASSSPPLLRGAPNYSIDTVLLCRSNHAKVLQATASEGLAQGSYVAVGVGFEPATFRMQGAELNTKPPRPTIVTAYAVLTFTPP